MRVYPNPRPNGPRPQYHESSELRSPRDSDSVARQWLRNRAHGNQGQFGVQNIQQLQRQIDRMRFRKGFGTDGITGLRWAIPKEFDRAITYEQDELVFISPTNIAATTGVSNGIDPAAGGALVGVDGFGADSDKALPGLWCCVHTSRELLSTQPAEGLEPNYKVHVPWWMPNMDVDDETESVAGIYVGIYWVLIAFYPIELEICVGGVPVPHYVHAQPVPTASVSGEGEGEAITGEGGEGFTGE